MVFKINTVVKLRSLVMFFLMLPPVFFLFTVPVSARVIDINITVNLDDFQIYDCGGGAYPVGTKCWTNNGDSSSSITPQTVNLSEDTLVIHLDFAGEDRIRWETDGISVPVFGDESVQVGASGSGSCCGPATYENSLSFLGVTGDLNYNPLEWSSNSGGSGGIVSQSYNSGLTNLTDSYFEFNGLVSTIGPYTNSSNELYEIDRISIFLTSGNFSYVSTVPIPATVWLFGSGLLGLMGVARRKKS